MKLKLSSPDGHWQLVQTYGWGRRFVLQILFLVKGNHTAILFITAVIAILPTRKQNVCL